VLAGDESGSGGVRDGVTGGSWATETRRRARLLGAGTHLGREGEGEEEVITGQEPGAKALEPGLGPVVLALRAVAVAAGVEAVVQVVAAVTGVEGTAQGGGTAADDVPHGPEVGRRDAPLEGVPVGLAGLAEDVRQLPREGVRLEVRGSRRGL
jgi:hypothetical protein